MFPDPEVSPPSPSGPGPSSGFTPLAKSTNRVPSDGRRAEPSDGDVEAEGGSPAAAELEAKKHNDCENTGSGKCEMVMERRRARPDFYDPSPNTAQTRPRKRGRGRPRGRGNGSGGDSPLDPAGAVKRGRGRPRGSGRSGGRSTERMEQILSMKKEPQDVPSNNLQTASPILGNACKGEHQRKGICSLSNQATQVTDTIYEDTCASHSKECSVKVQVGPYTVKPSAALTLQAIMKKHGDIGKDCLFESVYMRTLAVEGICKVVQELEMTKLLEMDKSVISAYYSVVRDAQRMKLNVKWLNERLGEIYDAVQVLECNTELVNEEKQHVRSIEKMKKKLQADRATLEELRLNTEKQESALAVEMQLTEKLLNKIKDLTSKFRHLHKSLVDGLL